MRTSLITNNTSYPKFIREHNIFSSISKIEKVFPAIGLRNCSLPLAEFQDGEFLESNFLTEKYARRFYANDFFWHLDNNNINKLIVKSRFPENSHIIFSSGGKDGLWD